MLEEVGKRPRGNAPAVAFHFARAVGQATQSHEAVIKNEFENT